VGQTASPHGELITQPPTDWLADRLLADRHGERALVRAGQRSRKSPLP